MPCVGSIVNTKKLIERAERVASGHSFVDQAPVERARSGAERLGVRRASDRILYISAPGSEEGSSGAGTHRPLRENRPVPETPQRRAVETCEPAARGRIEEKGGSATQATLQGVPAVDSQQMRAGPAERNSPDL